MPPSSQSIYRFFLPKTMNRASAKDRLVAAIIDFMVLSVLSSFIIGAFGSAGSMLSVFLSYAYFILAHKFFGVTVGKQAMGIFLASNDSNGLTWSQVILREIFWKWLSAFLLMYGYLRIYFVGEALHDKFSQTSVVSVKKAETSFATTALVTVAIVVVFISSVYYGLTQTSFLGHYFVKKLEAQGHIIRGLKGNPKKGWTVDYWRGQSPQGTYELYGVRFLYDFSNLYDTGTLRIKEVNVSRGLYHMNDLPAFLKKQKAEQVSPISKKVITKKPVDSFLKKVIVDKVNFSNMKITRAGADDIDIKRFYIQKFEIDRQRASLSQAFIDAPFIKFQMWNSYADLDGSLLDIKSEFELRKGLHSSILKTIKGRVEFTGDIKTPKNIRVEAFDGRLKLNYKLGRFVLQARELTPSRYLQYDTHLTNITAVIKNEHCTGYNCLLGNRGSGVFYHNKKKFLFKGTDVWAEEAPEEEHMKLQLTSLWMNAFTKSPIFSVSTDLDLKDFVSQIYHQKTFLKLEPNDQLTMEKIGKDFFKYSNRNVSSEPKFSIPSRDDFNK